MNLPAGKEKTYILGLSAFYHDSAACLVCNGEIIAAAQQERFSRKKHDPDFPTDAIVVAAIRGGFVTAGADRLVRVHQASDRRQLFALPQPGDANADCASSSCHKSFPDLATLYKSLSRNDSVIEKWICVKHKILCLPICLLIQP